jgi:hypothetical protein
MITRQQTPLGFTLLKTMRSHAAHARYLAELRLDDDEMCTVVGYLATCQTEGIPSPYAYSPTKNVYLDSNGNRVLVSETSHRCYQAFEVSPQMLLFKTDDAAADYHIRFRKA